MESLGNINKIFERKIYDIKKRCGVFICIDDEKYIDFSSNDYLGLANYEKIKKQSITSISKYGTGATASRLLSGNYYLHTQLEEKIASFKQKEAALVFNSGYQANIGLTQTLFKKGDVIFSDKLNHASIIDGMKLSSIKFFRYKHNNVGHLKDLLRKQRKKFKRALVITESVFSMDGDIAPLKEIVSIKKEFDFEIMIDEAHATGVFGKTGSGIAEELGLSDNSDNIEYVMGTFSKGLGSFGAYFACSKNVKKYLINKCRSFIYSTALPPAVIAANIAAIDVVLAEPERREKLLENAQYFRDKLTSAGFKVLGCTQIVPVLIGDTKKAVQMAQKLRDKRYWVLPIRYPTVAKNKARLRFSLTSNHTKKMLDGLVDDLSKQWV